MTKLHEWQAFARASGLRGWSRLKKDDLVRFLIENLWWGGGPKMNKAARLRIRKHRKKNPLDEKNPAINVPVLIPEKRLVSPKAIPKVVEKNVETVVDWLNWLENVEDENLKKEVDPAVTKLKKEIEKLWKKQLVVEEGKSALKGFAKQFFIRGDDSVFPQEFLLKARGHVVKLLQENPHTKVKGVLNCKMSRLIGDEEIVDEPFFHSRQKKNLGTNWEIVVEMENEMIENLENFNRRGSNWVFEKVLFLEIHFARWNPLRGSGWIALPPALQKKKALINMKNEDDMCFKWCLARAVNPVSIHPERITPQLREQAEELNWEGCKFPMAVNKIKLFESRNPNISVNVFGWNGSVFPLKIVREEKEIHVDLLLLKTHFVLVKNFSRLLSSQVVCSNGQRFFCKRCLNSFPRAESLEKHQALCGEFEATKIEVPGGICSFHNFSKMMHLPVVGYADFESILKPTRRAASGKEKGTVQTHEHIPCGFAFHLVSPFLQMEPVVKRAKDETEKLPQEFVRELISSVKKAHLSLPNKKMFPLTDGEWKTFREAAVCWLCRKEFGNGNLKKVRDHCHFSGKFRGAAHSLCNFKFQRPKFTPVFFHNLQNYDAHLFVRALGTLEEVLEVTCIPNNEEKYISFSLKFELKKERREVAEGEWKEFVVKHEIRFLDSFKFTLAGLSSLVENLPQEELKETVKFFGEKSNLMTRKGVYPYEFMDGFEKFEKRLPKQTSFFSRLNQEKVSDEDFAHAQRVWKEFGCKNMGDFHDLYLLSDVLLLADVMESFRKLCEKHYELDPAHFFTTPGLAWDAMLKMTDVKLELLGDIDQLLMIEKGIRGGNSNVFKRFAKANNKFMKNFNPAKKSKFLVYLDANNLYGWAMSQPLPVGDFAWMRREELQNWERFVEDEEVGCILEVDLEYSRELHDLHNDFPLAPEILELGDCKKLTQNLRDKKEMVLHGRNLKQVLSLGMKLKSINRGISFSEKPFMKCYIDKNTELRAKGKTKFEKEFFKLMNNSVFGKTMENLRKRVSIELVKDADRAEKLVMKPNFADLKIFDEFLIAIKMKKTRVVMNKPIFAGMTILDLSKLLMFNFHYEYVKKKWKNVSVLYTDTDSLVLEIETEDFFADIAADVKEWFDTNDFSPEHPAVLNGMPIVPENKKKIGLMKDECCGAVMTEFVALKPKLYSFLTEEDEKIREKQKAKGVKKCIIRKSLRHENFVKCLNTGQSQMRKQSFFRSREHHLFTENMTKLALNPRDDKRVVLENGIDTLALGHWRVEKLCP